MSQRDVLKFLKKHKKKWFKAREINKKLNITTAHVNLRRLRAKQIVEFKTEGYGLTATYYYKHKER